MWQYRSKVIDVHDGDTITVDLDLGFDTWRHTKLRLIGINAPELATADGPKSKDALTRFVETASGIVYVETIKVASADPHDKTDVYGRYLAWIWPSPEQLAAALYRSSFNYLMWTGGFARRFMTPKEWPADG